MGTKKIAKKVAANIPPITAIPIAFWLAAPAPLASANGVTPKINAIDVIRIANLLFLRFSEIGWKNFDTNDESVSLRPIAYSSRLSKCGKAPVFMA